MKKKFKKNIIILSIIFSLLISIETLSRFFFNIKVSNIQNYSASGCSLNIKKFIPNCVIKKKRWEGTEEILYEIDKKGNRKSSLPYNSLNKINFVFLGDSFTYSYMNNEKESYVYLISNYIKSFSSIGYENRGFPPHGFLEIIENIKDEDFDEFDHIIYGITPNDIYTINFNSFQENTLKTKKEKNIFDKIILSLKSNFKLRSFQVGLSILLKNDLIYKKIWEERKGKDFINNSNNKLFKARYALVKEKLLALKKNKKDKLIIVTIPQKIQMVYHNLGYFQKSKTFEKEMEKICKNLKIKCILTLNNLKSKKKVKNTHFTVIGYLTPFGNKFISELIIKDKNFLNIYKK
jgi:hypothetical protein